MRSKTLPLLLALTVVAAVWGSIDELSWVDLDHPAIKYWSETDDPVARLEPVEGGDGVTRLSPGIDQLPGFTVAGAETPVVVDEHRQATGTEQVRIRAERHLLRGGEAVGHDDPRVWCPVSGQVEPTAERRAVVRREFDVRAVGPAHGRGAGAGSPLALTRNRPNGCGGPGATGDSRGVRRAAPRRPGRPGPARTAPAGRPTSGGHPASPRTSSPLRHPPR